MTITPTHEDPRTSATREFTTHLMNKLYSRWRFIDHPDIQKAVAFGNWPVDLFSVLLTVEIPDGVATVALREPITSQQFYSFTIRRYTGPKLDRLPEELCRLDNLDNLNPSDDAIQKAAQVLAEA